MKRLLTVAGIMGILSLTAACSLWPARPPLPRVHDFGPLPVAEHGATAALRLDAVAAPSWLLNNAIHYRLMYDDPTTLRDYADNRWAAPPADLLAVRLGYLLPPQSAGEGAVHKAYMLSAELLAFEQDFSSARAAHVRLTLEVSLRRAVDGRIIAQHRFVMTQPATPDVQGAITGLARLADAAALAAVEWAQTQARE